MCRGECDITSVSSDDSSSNASGNSNNNTNNNNVKAAASVAAASVIATTTSYEKGRAEDGCTIHGSLRPKYQQQQHNEQEQQLQPTNPPLRPAIIGIQGTWYDATRFAKHHPGGDIIYEFHNQDGTAQFLAYHSVKILERYKLPIASTRNGGTYDFDADQPGKSRMQGAWMKLNEKFEREGRYQTPLSFLYSRIAILILCLVGAISMIRVYVNSNQTNFFAFVLGAACLACIWQQSGFLMHDTMHNHILHDRKGDQRLGYIFGNILLGVSGTWWRDEHNEHHVFTNALVEGVGPADPQMIEDVWIQDERLVPYFVQSTVKFILEFQQFYFVPALVIVGLLPIKIDAIVHSGRFLPDVIGLTLHITWVGTILSLLPSNLERVAFYFLANCVSGCLGIQLLVSHYAKSWVEKETTKEAGSWARRQAEAVMDITCPTWLDWFHGGLHIHSVHHMFPRMCRCHYREVYDDIINLCEEHGVQLDRFSWFEAIGRCVHHFSTIKDKAAGTTWSLNAKKVE
jgi:delta8-fatty-acid desaturase